MTNLVKIIALSVDNRNITLWEPDGNTILIPQGDKRVARIVEEAKTKGLAPGNPVFVDVSIPVHRNTEYESVEKGTNGLIKFFRVAKKAIKDLLLDDSEPVVPLVPSIKMGEFDVSKLTSKAVTTFLNVREATEGYEVPEPTVTHTTWGNFKVVLTGFTLKHDRTQMVKIIREICNCEQTKALDLANAEWPVTLVNYLTEDAANDFSRRLSSIPGVHAVAVKVTATVEPFKETNNSKLDAAETKLKALGAIDTEADAFHTELKEDETIVAVVNDKVIPDVQNLQRQIRQSAKLADYKGFARFMERLAGVIDKRLHSVEDLMKFMEKGDLPIADDGSIVIYKRLKSIEDDKFVDCHSGRIKQWVGCKVAVKEELVDPDRRQDCSNGLHVASLTYLGSFFGNVTIIGKVAPEDVFAVPEYNTNKMRVSAYHIVEKLTNEQANVVNNGGSISTVDGGTELLNKVLTGNHDAPSTLVMVGGHKGSNLTYTTLSGEAIEASNVKVVKNKTTIDINEDLSNTANTADPVTAQQVKSVEEIKPAKAPTVKEQILELVKEFQNAATHEDQLAAADLLVELRGKARKPWAAFSVGSDVVDAIAVCRAAESKPEPVKAVKQDKTVKPAKAKVVKAAGKGKHADTIRGWLNDSGMSDYQKAHTIHDLKRAAKKSYYALGLSPDEIKAIDKLKHHLK